MARYLVTGGAGFIGSHLVDRLLERGDDVVVLDNFNDFYDPRIKRRNVASHLLHPRYRLVEGDLLDRESLERCFDEPVDLVFHLAAMAGVRPSIKDPELYVDVNLKGTTGLYEAVRASKTTKKVVFASSSSVYGENEKVPFGENDFVDNPISPYAATKKAGELISHTYHHLFGLDITCLRFFTVYGPRQRPDLAIHKFTARIERGESIEMFGDGSTQRDYTYIDDIIDGVLRAAEKCGGFRVYNLGESRPIALRDLIATIENALGKKAKIERKPEQPGDVPLTFADIALARRELGYAPHTDIQTGIARFVAWYRDTVADGARR